MKQVRLLVTIIAGTLSFCNSSAQFVVGTKGLTIGAGAFLSVDSLILVPSANYTIASNSLSVSHAATSGTGVPSIDRVFSFTNPLNNYSGNIGLRYATPELNGNYAPWLTITYTGDYTTWKVNRNSTSAANKVQTGGTGLTNDILLQVTAVNSASFYSKDTGDITLPGSWGVNVDGSGLNPAGFNNAADNFILANRSGSINLSADWNVNGGLTINNGIDLEISGHNLTVNNLGCNGAIGGTPGSAFTIKGNAGSIYFTPGANTLGAFTLDSNASASLVDTLNMAAGRAPGVLSVAYGATLNTGGYLRLLSDTFGTARLGNVSGVLNGNVMCMQYVPGGRRAYRFWAHPFSNYIPLSQIENYIDITGIGGSLNGFTTTASNSPSCYWYHTAVGNSTLASDPGWKPFNSCYGTVDTNRFKRYEGIRLFIRGAQGEGLGYVLPVPSPVTIGMYGPVNQGDQAVPLVKGVDTTKDYNMVGNPYASPIDIGTIIAHAKDAGLIRGAAFYVWNPYRGTAGGFEPKTIGSPYVIQAYNCFQVRAMVNGAVLGFSENCKAASAPEQLLRAEPQYMALQVYDTNYHPWDITYFNFTSEASDVEGQDDAGKLSNPDLSFYSLSADNHRLSIDSRPYKDGAVIPVGLSCNFAQQYIIRADQVVLPAGGKAYLHDKFLNKYAQLEQGDEYRFEVTDDSLTQGNARFELGMGEMPGQSTGSAIKLGLAPNPATDEITVSFTMAEKGETTVRVVDMAGVCVFNRKLGSKQNGSTIVKLDKLPAGMYIVELESGGKKVADRFVKE